MISSGQSIRSNPEDVYDTAFVQRSDLQIGKAGADFQVDRHNQFIVRNYDIVFILQVTGKLLKFFCCCLFVVFDLFFQDVFVCVALAVPVCATTAHFKF